MFYVGVLVVALVFLFFICMTDDIPAERWKTTEGYIRIKHWESEGQYSSTEKLPKRR